MSISAFTPADALRKALGAAMLADPALDSVLGAGRVHDAVPDRLRPPYVVVGRTTSADWSTATENGEAVTLFLHVWTRQERRDENHAAQAAIRAIAEGPLTLPGHHLVALRHELSETRRDAQTGHVHGVLRFRAIIEPNDD